MANADAPFGFRPAMNGAGGTPGRLTEYQIASAYATAIGFGDAVKLASDGTIQLATAGDQIIGVFLGVKYTATDGSFVFKKNWVASTASLTGSTNTALVNDDPDAIYEVISDTSTTQTSVGQFANLVASAVDSNGVSTMSVVHGGAETQFQITKLITDRPVRNAAGNQGLSETGTFALVQVRPIIHQKRAPGAVLTEV